MENGKTLDNDGLSKDFYEVFWDDVKIPLLTSINDAFTKEGLNTSQKEVLIKLVEIKYRGERFINNWRLIFLLNTY